MIATQDAKRDTVNCFRLKGSLFTLTILELYDPNPDLFSEQLQNKIKQAPLFFRSTPIVIDLKPVAETEVTLNFNWLVDEIRAHGLIPIGIRNGSEVQCKEALEAGLAILSSQSNDDEEKPTESKVEKTKQVAVEVDAGKAYLPTKVITQPIRSGQRIYAQCSDLLVLASVSAGAEIIADGHIHVYGPLRGRALAGVTGNENARIFCESLEAELISIAGYYKVSENLKTSLWKQRAHIHLSDKQLNIDSIG